MTLGAEYFKIQPPRQAANPLADMMSSLFGGGAPGDSRGAPAGRGRGRGIGPAAGGLD